MTSFRLFAAALLLASVPSLFAGPVTSDKTLVIVKRAGEANPGLFLADFQGPDEMRQRLQRALTQCDWFSVLSSPKDATYVLRAAYSAAPAPCLDMEITGGGAGAKRFRQATSSARPGWVVYQAVDTLIAKLFNNTPGLCASSLAFANGSRGYKELFTCNFDGTDARQLTFNRSISTEPSWGPRGSALVYTLYHDNVTDVVLADVVNRRHRPISQFPGLNAGAALSPDGQWAALCLSCDRKVELYVLRVSDHAKLRLTNDTAVESSPTWSPDGARICFVSDRAGKPNLYLISARGGTATALPRTGAESVSPDWSRVSNKVCYATGGGGNYQLAVLDMATPGAGVQTIRTDRGGSYESPSWAPDGRHVVATRQTDVKRELCMVDTWTGKVTRITTAGDFSLPSWSDLHN